MKSLMILIFVSLFSMYSTAQDSGEVKDPNAATAPTPADQALTTTTPAATETAPATSAEFGEVTGTQKYKYTCVLGAETRTITVITQADNSVGVVYNKAGVNKTIVLAKNDPAYADEKAEKVKTNLETAGYTCTKE